MSKLIASMALALCLAGAGGLAVAGGSDQKVGEFNVHMAADYNRDGKVVQAEHLAWARSSFAQMDLNGDGFIDAAEITQFQMKRLEAMRKVQASPDDKLNDTPPAIPVFKFPPELDQDGDGKVSLAEHLDYETRVFKANANPEGVITARDILARDRQVKAEIDRKLRLLREQNKAVNQQPMTYGYQSTQK